MRALLALPALAAALLAGQAAAAPSPVYEIAFAGSGTEHQVDNQQNIQDSGACDSAEHVDVTAALRWSTSWTSVKTGGKSALATPTTTDGSQLTGTHVKDACGLPLDQAPDGWVSQASCSAPLETSSSPTLALAFGKQALSLALTAPSYAVPVGTACPLNVRNDQLAAHVLVPLKKLRSLKKGAALTFSVGTTAPGPGDVYAPSLDCSQPTKPYEGYRTADHCQDNLSWSGTVRVTRAR
jgi:hypothetical protein